MSLGAEIKARMSLDSSGVKAGVAQADKAVSGMKTQLSGVGKSLAAAFSVGAIVNFSKSVVEYAGKLSDMAEQTGLSTDQLQAFQVAVSDAGGTLEGAGRALLKFRNMQDAALSGDKTAAAAFAKLGISMEEVAKKSTPELLEAVAKGYQKFRDFGAAVDLFGIKRAGEMEAALKSLAGGFDAMTESAKRSGEVMSSEDILKLAVLDDQLDRLSIRMKTFWGPVLSGVMDFGQKIANGIASSFILIETIAGRVVKNVQNIMKGNFRDVTWTPGGLIREGLAASWQGFNDMSEVQSDEKAAVKKRIEEEAAAKKALDAQNRQKNLAALKAKDEADKANALYKLASSIEDDIEAGSKQIERAKEAAQKAQDLGAAAVEAATEKTEEAFTEVPASIAEIRGGETRQFQQRFDSLRQIGANVLGSGKIGGTSDRISDLVNYSRDTAQNTARLVQKLDAPPVTRIAQSTPVF